MVCCRLQYNLLTFYFSLKELPANSHIDHVLQFWFYIQQHDDTDRIALEVSIDLRKAQYEKQLAGKFSSLKNKSKPHKILWMKRSELIWCDLAKWTHDRWLLHPSPPSSRCRCHAVIFISFRGKRRGQTLFWQSVRQTVSISDVFMVPLPNHPPDRSRFTAGTGAVNPLSGPRGLVGSPTELQSVATFIPSRFSVSHSFFFTLRLSSAPRLRYNLFSVFILKWA